MSDYETAQRKRNIIVGIFVILALCSLVWLIFKFGDLPTAVSKISSFEVFVQFPSAPGVQKDTPVRFCGYQIGRVTKVMAPSIRDDLKTHLKYHQTVAVLSIDKKYINIPADIEVKLMTRGFGSSYIELAVDPLKVPEPNDPKAKFLTDGMFLQGATSITSEFFPEESQEKLDKLANGLDELIGNANDIIGDNENKENIKEILANLNTLSNQANQAIKEFQKFFANAAQASEQISKTAAELRIILTKINNGQGTAAKLINDGRLYEDLLENTRQLELLIQDMKSFVDEYRKKGIKVQL
ncbi:MAG: MCE family protein [Sedimentisphaerales bacterium]|nr:MCE family protein [Sedimentisphaerales bacterium]